MLAFAVQLITAYQIIRVRDRALSISSVFAVLWVIYFPLRLLVIIFGGPSPYYFSSVRFASPEQLMSACEVTTAALLLFLISQAIVNRTFRLRGSVDNVHVAYGQYVTIGIVGTGVTTFLTFLHVSSGILSNVGDLVLFAIAGMAYLTAKAGRISSVSLLLVVVASAFGYLNGYKLQMLLPPAAWLIGRAGAGDRVRLRYIVVAAAATTIAFGVIQGERDALLNGRPITNPVATLQFGLGSYDLASGGPADYQGLGIVGNVVSGVLYRLKGADYYIAITDRVPSVVPYQAGRSLWEPALSVLPGAKQFLGLHPEYRQLNLEEWADRTFISETPSEHTPAESVTPAGDLYLNFGIAGVLVGMLILGGLYGMFDRAFTIQGPVSAAVVAFAGLYLADLDTNLAYALVTCGLRLGICAVLLTWISLSQRKPDQRDLADRLRA